MADMEVTVCQQEIVKLDLRIKAIIHDIHEYPDLETLQTLNQDAREKVQEVTTRLKELERLGNEQDKETDKLIVLRDVQNHIQQLSNTQMSLRKANLECQLTIEKREKRMLLDGGTSAKQRGKSNKAKESVAKTASDITESLMSLSRTMAANVTVGEQTVGTLVTSSKQIGETNEEFKNMSGHIKISRRLLTKYSRRECTDKLLIFLAMVFFFACVLYIVKKRVFSSSDPQTSSRIEL